ncbi:hypothetical protein [Pontibacter flavimaris]|nr:hypothetical protein [Pontibacter flavimaris]
MVWLIPTDLYFILYTYLAQTSACAFLYLSYTLYFDLYFYTCRFILP